MSRQRQKTGEKQVTVNNLQRPPMDARATRTEVLRYYQELSKPLTLKIFKIIPMIEMWPHRHEAASALTPVLKHLALELLEVLKSGANKFFDQLESDGSNPEEHASTSNDSSDEEDEQDFDPATEKKKWLTMY